jgi:superfamily II helicase
LSIAQKRAVLNRKNSGGDKEMDTVEEFSDEWYIQLYKNDIKIYRLQKIKHLMAIREIDKKIKKLEGYINEIKGVNENVK